MKLLLLGSNYFQRPLRELGHDVIWAGAQQGCDCLAEDWDLDLKHLIPRLPFKPDAVLLTDDLGKRVLPRGLEEIAAVKVWYAVDSPINRFWQIHYASLFHLILVDQKQGAVELGENTPLSRVKWLPVAVDTGAYKGAPSSKTHDLAFVGVINSNVRPKRSRIINLLSQRYNVRTAGGRLDQWITPQQSAQLYRQSRIVLNENLFGGVTTRMLEAMASGAMLLTEGHDSIADLFDIGVDLDVYGPANLFDQVDYYLAHPEHREQIAKSGHEKVMSGHDLKNRAGEVIGLIEQTLTAENRAEILGRPSEEGKALFLAALRWQTHGGQSRILRAEHLLNTARQAGTADAEALFYLGQIKIMKGDNQNSRGLLKLAAQAGHIKSKIGLALMDLKKAPTVALGKLYSLAVRYELDFPRSHSGNGLSADQHHALGKILEAAGHDLTPGFSRYGLGMTMWDALEHYRAAVEKQPDHAPSLIALGTTLSRHGAHAEAQVFLDGAMQIHPHWPGLAEKHSLAYHLGYGWAASDRKVA